MLLEKYTILLICSALGIVFWLRWRSSQPEFPPLNTDPDDPLMRAASTQAKETLNEFKKLLNEPHNNALVKIRFISSSNEVEYLWAEVLNLIDSDTLSVRLVTPPVTHTGQLERVWKCTFKDIEDWQVRDGKNLVHGGYSQRGRYV